MVMWNHKCHAEGVLKTKWGWNGEEEGWRRPPGPGPNPLVAYIVGFAWFGHAFSPDLADTLIHNQLASSMVRLFRQVCGSVVAVFPTRLPLWANIKPVVECPRGIPSPQDPAAPTQPLSANGTRSFSFTQSHQIKFLQQKNTCPAWDLLPDTI